MTVVLGCNFCSPFKYHIQLLVWPDRPIPLVLFTVLSLICMQEGRIQQLLLRPLRIKCLLELTQLTVKCKHPIAEFTASKIYIPTHRRTVLKNVFLSYHTAQASRQLNTTSLHRNTRHLLNYHPPTDQPYYFVVVLVQTNN